MRTQSCACFLIAILSLSAILISFSQEPVNAQSYGCKYCGQGPDLDDPERRQEQTQMEKSLKAEAGQPSSNPLQDQTKMTMIQQVQVTLLLVSVIIAFCTTVWLTRVKKMAPIWVTGSVVICVALIMGCLWWQ